MHGMLHLKTIGRFLGLAMLPIALGLFALLGYILDHLVVEVDDEDENLEETEKAPV